MNIALPGLLIILGLVPGIVFWNAYFSGRFPRQFSGASTVLELAQYILLAIPLNGFALWVYSSFVGPVHVGLIRDVLTGSVAPTAAVARLEPDVLRTVVAYVVLVTAAGLMAIILRHLVWALRLDLRFPILRMRSNWYYTLLGRDSEFPRWHTFPYADIVCKHPDGSRIYQGMIFSFEPTGDGKIKSLIVTDAHRGKGRGEDFEWKRIPGHRLIIMGDNIHSINMRYVTAVETEFTFRERLGLFLRSLFLQEP